MAKTHWKKLQNPDYLGAYALQPGEELTLTIKSVSSEMVTGPDGKKEECMVCRFSERDVKPMILNTTNCKTIAKIYKTNYIEEWTGKQITIFASEVRAFGETVEALRIRPYIPKAETYTCESCNQIITPSHGLSAAAIADRSRKKYGKMYCMECSMKAKEESEKMTKESINNEDSENQG